MVGLLRDKNDPTLSPEQRESASKAYDDYVNMKNINPKGSPIMLSGNKPYTTEETVNGVTHRYRFEGFPVADDDPRANWKHPETGQMYHTTKIDTENDTPSAGTVAQSAGAPFVTNDQGETHLDDKAQIKPADLMKMRQEYEGNIRASNAQIDKWTKELTSAQQTQTYTSQKLASAPDNTMWKSAKDAADAQVKTLQDQINQATEDRDKHLKPVLKDIESRGNKKGQTKAEQKPATKKKVIPGFTNANP